MAIILEGKRYPCKLYNFFLNQWIAFLVADPSSYFRKALIIAILSVLFNRPVVAGAVLQTPSLLIQSVTQPFPPNLQNVINHKA